MVGLDFFGNSGNRPCHWNAVTAVIGLPFDSRILKFDFNFLVGLWLFKTRFGSSLPQHLPENGDADTDAPNVGPVVNSELSSIP